MTTLSYTRSPQYFMQNLLIPGYTWIGPNGYKRISTGTFKLFLGGHSSSFGDYLVGEFFPKGNVRADRIEFFFDQFLTPKQLDSSDARQNQNKVRVHFSEERGGPSWSWYINIPNSLEPLRDAVSDWEMIWERL